MNYPTGYYFNQNNMKNNIFISFLELLGVKHRVSYSSRFFNEHPYKYSLYGLSSMLMDYGIDNAGVKITDKTSVSSIGTPFIAHIGSDFVIVEKWITIKSGLSSQENELRFPRTNLTRYGRDIYYWPTRTKVPESRSIKNIAGKNFSMLCRKPLSF